MNSLLSPRGSDEERVIQATQEIEIEGKRLKYTSETGRIALRDVETGKSLGYMFYIASCLLLSTPPMPVTILGNGGPGANSSLLHFFVAGPKIAEGERLIDNAEAWLTVGDLVFVDPMGCGFSRPAKAEFASEFYVTGGDIASVAEFVRCRRLLHEAGDFPVVIVGKS